MLLWFLPLFLLLLVMVAQEKINVDIVLYCDVDCLFGFESLSR